MIFHTHITLPQLQEYLNIGNELRIVNIAMVDDLHQTVGLVIDDPAERVPSPGVAIRRLEFSGLPEKVAK